MRCFHIARQRSELFGMVGTPQQVKQAFFVVFARALERHQTGVQVGLELSRIEAGGEQVATGQLVDHARVLHQVACRPTRRAQQAQQTLMDGGTLQQQRQVNLTAHQGFEPIGHAQHCNIANAPDRKSVV